MQLFIPKIKYFFYLSILWTFTFLNFLAFLVSRDHDWIHNPGQAWMNAGATEFRTYPSSDFERTLSCYGLGQCQRIGGALIFQPLIFMTDLLSKFYYWDLNAESRIFIIQMVGLGWRIVSFAIFGFCIYHFSKNTKFALFFINTLFFALSGWLLRLVGYLIEKLPGTSDVFKQRSILAFQDFPYENFKWYDYGLFAVLAIIAILVIRVSEKKVSLLKFFILGLITTSFFEYLGFVLAFSFIIFRPTKTAVKEYKIKLNQALFIILGSTMWLAFILIYHRSMQLFWPKFFDATSLENGRDRISGSLWAIQHPIENLTSNPSIMFQIFLVIIQSALLGLMTGLIARVTFKSVRIESGVIQSFKSVNIAMAFVILVTLFIAYGVKIQAGEHARQTLGLQISLFTYIFLNTATQKSKNLVKGISNSYR